MQLYLKLTGIPLLIPVCNEHTACTGMLKGSNIPKVAVELEHYCTYVALHIIYVATYVKPVQDVRRYSSTGFIHIIMERIML